MSDEILFDFPIPVTSYSGEVEHTDLVDVDRAVSGFIKMVVNSLVVTDTERTENKEFARLVERDANSKVFFGESQDPSSFARQLVSKFVSKGKKERHAILPAVLVSRDPTIMFADSGEYIDLTGAAELSGSNGTYAMLNKSFLTLTYNLLFVAWSRPTLDRLALGLLMWLRHTKSGRKHVFSAKTKLAGSPMQLKIAIKARKDASIAGQEFDFEGSRLVSAQVTIEVVAEMYEAEGVGVVTGRAEVMGAEHVE